MAEREGLRPGIQAQLSVRQGRAAIEFYKAAFGATELFRFGGDDADEEIAAQLAVGDGSSGSRTSRPITAHLDTRRARSSTCRLFRREQPPLDP